MAQTSLSDDEIKKIKVRANGENNWTPAKYTRFYIFVFLYNKVAGNPREFGLPANSNDNTVIEEYMKNNIEFLFAKYNIYKNLAVGFDIDQFKSEFNEYSIEGKSTYNSYFKRNAGEMLSIDEMNDVMRAKYYNVHKKFMDMKKPTDPINSMLDFDKDGKPVYKDIKEDGYYYNKMKVAKATLKAKRKLRNRSLFRTIGHFFLSAICGAGIVASLATLIAGGGAAVAAIFGTSLFATGVGSAVVGIGGSVVSFILGKYFLGKGIGHFAKLKKLNEDLRDFKNGTNKYAPDGKEFKGYKDIEREYKMAMEGREIMVKGVGDAKKEFDNELVEIIVTEEKKKKDGTIELKKVKRKVPLIEAISIEQEEYEKALKTLLASNPHPSEKDLVKLRNDYLKHNYYTDKQLIAKYQAYTKAHHPEYCKRSMVEGSNENWEEIAKNAVYDYQVQRDGSVFKTIMANANPFNPSQDRTNNRTVGDFVREVDAISSDKNLTLRDLSDYYDDLTKQKNQEMFSSHDSVTKYNELKKKIAETIVDKVREIVYSEPLTDSSVEQIEDALDDPVVKDAIANAGIGGETSKFKDITKFVNIESSNKMSGLKTLRNDLDVSVENQYSLRKSAIVSACESFDTANIILPTSPERADLEDIATKIEGLAKKSDATAISSDIDAKFGAKPKVREYLHFMLDKKQTEVKLSAADMTGIAASPAGTRIIGDISSLTEKDCISLAGSDGTAAGLSKVDNIRSDIMSSLKDTEQEKALKYLETQTASIEAKRRNDTLLKSFKRLHGSNNVAEQIDAIEKISYCDFNADNSITDLYTKIKGYAPEVQDYLKMKLSERVYEKCIQESGMQIYMGGNTESVKKILEFYQRVTSCWYLNPAQKNRIITSVEKRFGGSLYKGIMEEAKTMLASKSAAEEMYKKITAYKTGGYSQGGLSDYFTLNTPMSAETKNLVEKINMILVQREKMFASVYDGRETGDTTVPLKILLSMDFDKMKQMLTKFQNSKNAESKVNSAIPSKLNTNGIDSSNFADIIKPFKDELDSILSSSATDSEKLIQLMILRKNCLSSYKQSMLRFITSFGSTNLQSFYNSYPVSGKTGEVLIDERINTQWKVGVVNELDNAISTKLSDPSIRSMIDGWEGYEVSASTIIDYTRSSENIEKFKQGREPGEMHM